MVSNGHISVLLACLSTEPRPSTTWSARLLQNPHFSSSPEENHSLSRRMLVVMHPAHASEMSASSSAQPHSRVLCFFSLPIFLSPSLNICRSVCLSLRLTLWSKSDLNSIAAFSLVRLPALVVGILVDHYAAKFDAYQLELGAFCPMPGV